MKYRLFCAFAILFLTSGCSLIGGNDDSKKSLTDGLSPKALYDLSKDKVSDGSLNKANEYLDIIIAAYPSSKYAVQARLDIAYNLFRQKKYSLAIVELDDFIQKFPAIESTPYAYYLKGVVAEEKSSSILDNLITDSAQRDVESVKEAYLYYKDLIDTFPQSKYSEQAKKKLNTLRDTLARHEFYVALYYTKNYSHIAAINRCKYILENYPNSNSIANALHLMAHNYEIINANELAIDARNILNSSFPAYTANYLIE